MNYGVYVLASILFFISLYAIYLFNRFRFLENSILEAKSDIDVFLKKRHDMVSSLVNTVKGYSDHEKELQTRVADLRSVAQGIEKDEKPFGSETLLTNSLKSIFAVVENYPDLNADKNFMQLQRELTETEDEIERVRRYFNAYIKKYNTIISIFPNSIFAKIFGRKEKEFLKFDAKSLENIDVKID